MYPRYTHATLPRMALRQRILPKASVFSVFCPLTAQNTSAKRPKIFHSVIWQRKNSEKWLYIFPVAIFQHEKQREKA